MSYGWIVPCCGGVVWRSGHVEYNAVRGWRIHRAGLTYTFIKMDMLSMNVHLTASSLQLHDCESSSCCIAPEAVVESSGLVQALEVHGASPHSPSTP